MDPLGRLEFRASGLGFQGRSGSLGALMYVGFRVSQESSRKGNGGLNANWGHIPVLNFLNCKLLGFVDLRCVKKAAFGRRV